MIYAMNMSPEESALMGFKKPSWLHPLKRLKYNNMVRDLKIAARGISRKHDELAPIFMQDHDNIIIVMTYCRNGTGDMAQHRSSYTFNGKNKLYKRANLEDFYNRVLRNRPVYKNTALGTN